MSKPDSESEQAESEDEVQGSLIVESTTIPHAPSSDVEMEIPGSSEPEHISFAPRLVVKTNSEQEQLRFKTPELVPIDVEDTITIPRSQFEVEGGYGMEVRTPRMAFASPIRSSPVKTPPVPASATTTNTMTSVDPPKQLPSTPQRRQPQPPQPSPQQPQQDSKQTQERETSPPPFIPFLSKLPLTPFVSLSDAELDMTVEEWIRYQMEVEFDKFKRDGERELVRFRKRAEEVRKVIDGL
ncbi:hypothetical protein AGABI1DRAFT_111882 [Agaricus bisporus var. burnettii JB137-S8]|uniref:Uncharacterized protein n=1 Tax=Agaricus bisporus var. burnettii (strain JB137-S8 / ATCC MYA-4627 / FGSC 10392) TaxID=597362 RepID=K5W4A5_AGABU|nr:uncharacterized protein AGABI1DRAFT_111882 [Agaricus bisporus var. burnettii JB137-S8]EKM81599.1 hypothetical protein AGABI1DRAFT_111882 [Agaricus bisporus var. burnettii JB137-S8]